MAEAAAPEPVADDAGMAEAAAPVLVADDAGVAEAASPEPVEDVPVPGRMTSSIDVVREKAASVGSPTNRLKAACFLRTSPAERSSAARVVRSVI